ncbi:MAG: ABC transporter ATP-binding protein [Bowdeniella nasicola]|nr:ABC transporter ATP-binding protein [Bowdeniella nasicola]
MSADLRLRIENVTKTFTLRHRRSLKELAVAMLTHKDPGIDTFDALKGVSLQVREAETIALLGFNGSGKSTLLKLISGVMRPDGGRVLTRGRVAGLIEVGAGFHPDLTGRENVFLNGAILGMSKAEIDAAYDSIVAFSEIERFMDTEVKFYSSGMFLRLAFAVAVHSNPETFLIDEILAVGDEPFQRKCLTRVNQLKEEGRSLVIVSHDLDLVSSICERGVVLREGRLVFDGDVHDAVDLMREDQRH